MGTENTQRVLARYTTPQFRHDPLGSLIKLMGLQDVKDEIRANASTVFPILCGIMVYRHLDQKHRSEINRSIINDIPRSRLTTKLMGLVGELSRDYSIYAWSLTDKELRASLERNKGMAETLEAIGVSTISAPSVTSVAAVLYDTARTGAKAQAAATVREATSASRVVDLAERLGISSTTARGLGLLTVAALAALALMYANASANQERAKRELALRNLLRLEDW
ncbi:hypothetical protein QQM79_12365 [Marinobacteraceae bacterium S3BR75-40.1]